MSKYAFIIEDYTKSKRERVKLEVYNLSLEEAEKLRDSNKYKY